ncbi:MAG TPA: phage tail protein [Pyrinomonadaceae bacterium]|jgi:phage tail-like protein|nr:phage tail protein [Pyrinomonadaceae bacterium]
MHATSKNNFVYLNRDGRWPGFKHKGIDLRDDGSMALGALPRLVDVLPDGTSSASPPDGAGGIAIDSLGAIYFTDSAHDRVFRISGCDKRLATLAGVGGTNGLPAGLRQPRGLLVPQHRHALFVADSLNHRIEVFDLNTLQLVDIWGQPDPGAPPQSDSAPGRFNQPFSLDSDRGGNVYVVDYGNQRVQKFNSAGRVIPEFWQNASANSGLRNPSQVAVLDDDGAVQVFVLDLAALKIFAFDSDGFPIIDPEGVGDSHLQQPSGLIVNRNALFVGDNGARRIFRFQIPGFEFMGAAIGYDGPVAALALDEKGSLWVHPGNSLAPLLLQVEGGACSRGVLWTGQPVQVNRRVDWYRLSAITSGFDEASHLELFVYATDDPADAPAVDPASDNPFSDARWRPLGFAGNFEIDDLYVGGGEFEYLFCGALLSSDGSSTPVLTQLRVEFDYPRYESYLPAVYRNNKNCDDFVARLLSLFESIFADVEQEIESLPKLFDPRVAPKKFLPWLAGVVGFELDGNLSESAQREIIAEIFRYYGRRGTRAGLRDSLRLFAQVDAIIDEPLLNAGWWTLPGASSSCSEHCHANSGQDGNYWNASENSILGTTTMLAGEQPQGAVVGTSAILDQSSLISDSKIGSPLFAETAYQFSVRIYQAQLRCAQTLSRIKAVIEQEKPAHTTYHLCVVAPRMRVGFQSRVGVDTVVGGQARSLALGTDQHLGDDTLLAGTALTRLGAESRLGLNTRLN